MLESNLEPKELQMFYNRYAKHLHHHEKDGYRSINYHMKAAKTPLPSKYRANSIMILNQIQNRGKNRRCQEIQHFLATLQEEPDTLSEETRSAAGLSFTTNRLAQEVEDVVNEPCLRPGGKVKSIVPAAIP